MATLKEFTSVFSRSLSINGVSVSQSVLDDLMEVRIEDGVDSQDIMTLDFDNPYQKYFDGHQFQRGMAVSFTGGMVGGRIEELFRGKMEKPNARGGSDGETISIRCTALDMLKTESVSAYSDPLEMVTVQDALTRIFKHIGLSVDWKASAPHVQSAKTIVTSFVSRSGETAVQFAARLTRQYLGASIQVSCGRAIIRDPSQAISAPTIEWELEWRKNIDRYDVPERTENRAPRESKAAYTPPDLSELEKMFNETYHREDFPTQEAWDNVLSEYERSRQAYEAIIKADAEAQLKARSAKKSAKEYDLEISISNLDNIVSGSWGRVLGLGPYSGIYHVAEISRVIRGDYEQTLKLDSRRAI